MKKLLFIIAFVFIGQQAFSQFYIVMTDDPTVGGCLTAEVTLTKVDPFGNKTNSCISKVADVGIVQLNLELNSIASLGYKLVEGFLVKIL